MISIHALREEGDRCRSTLSSYACIFLSTPSARRATKERRILSVQTEISIHALREEGDSRAARLRARNPISIHALREEGDATGSPSLLLITDFYPRPPRGGRPVFVKELCTTQAISIHALREEGDSKNRDKISIFKQIIQHSARI